MELRPRPVDARGQLDGTVILDRPRAVEPTNSGTFRVRGTRADTELGEQVGEAVDVGEVLGGRMASKIGVVVGSHDRPYREVVAGGGQGEQQRWHRLRGDVQLDGRIG